MKEFSVFGISLSVWFAAPLFYGAWVTTGWILKRILFATLEHLSKKTETELDDVFLAALNWPALILIFVSGAVVVFEFLIPQSPTSKLIKYAHTGFKIGAIISIILFANKLLLGLIRYYAARIAVLRVSRAITEVVVQTVVLALGALVLLDSVGVSITPFIASLGIGSLAVALALQPTLENIISGFQILADHPIIPGQYVRLESGEEGYVEDIGWRSTRIRQLANNTVIIPNKLLINSRILNFHSPDKELAVLVEMGVHYASDLEKVERVTTEVATEILKRVEGGVPNFEPLVRYHSFGPSSINFTVVLRAKEYVDGILIKHEFIKSLAKRYGREGIVIPFPIISLNTEQEKAALTSVLKN